MSQKFLNGVSVDGGNITVGESNATNNHVKVFHSDETYTELHGFGIITDRTSYYIRPSTDGTQALYIGGADASLDWTSINFKYTSSINFVRNGTTIFDLNSSNNATFAGSVTTDSILAANNFALDVGGNISLDADSGSILLKDGGTQYLTFTKSGNNAHIVANRQDGDIKFFGNDGGSSVTALTLDMSEGGNATFAGTIGATNFSGSSSGTNTGDQVLPTDFVSAANGGTFGGNITIENASTPALLLKDTTNPDLEVKIRAGNNYGYFEVDNTNTSASSRLQMKIDGVNTATFMPNSFQTNTQIRITDEDTPALFISKRKNTGGAILNGQDIGRIDFLAQDTVDLTSEATVGRITVEADGDYSSTSKKSRYKFSVNTGTGIETALTINSDKSLTVAGNLVISGTTTTLNTQTVEVEDNILQLNTTQGTPDTATAATSGISVYRGDGVTQASLIFDDGDDRWDLTNHLRIGGQLSVDSHVQTTTLYSSGDLRLLNKAGDAWLTFADRNTSATEAVYDLANVGTLSTSGNATFAGSITTTSVSGISIDTGGNAILTLDGASGSTEAIIFKHSGTEVSRISHSNSTNLIFSTGSSVTTALTLDNSQNATFAGTIGATNFSGSSSGTNTGDQDLSSYLTASSTQAKYLRSDEADQMSFAAGTTEMLTFNNSTSAGKIQIGFRQNDSDGSHHRSYLKSYKAPNTSGIATGKLDLVVRSSGGGVTADILELEAGQDAKWQNNKIWTSGNDGTGSGLDADTLDGNHASAFAPSSVVNQTDFVSKASGGTFGGNITVQDIIMGSADRFRQGSYLELSYGASNTSQFTFNADYDGSQTGTYTPQYSGGSSAGMSVVKMPSGGIGGLDFYVKNHGTTTGSHNIGTFTKILSLNQNGTSTFGGNVTAGGNSLTAGSLDINGTADFSGKVEFQGDAAIEGGTGYGVFKGYTANNNHFISVRGIVANSSTLSITGGHQTTFVEHADAANEGWYFKSFTTGTYREIARIDGLNEMYLGGNQVYHEGHKPTLAELGAAADTVVNQTDFVSKASGGTFTGDLNVHTGAGTGALSVGRSDTQAIKLHVNDTVNTIFAYQDSDGDGDHQFILRRDFQGTGASDFKIQNGSTSQLLINKDGLVTIPGNAIISGNLTVNGTQTILNTATIEVEDNIIVLNKTASDGSATAATSGIAINRGGTTSDASFIFDDADDFWDLTHNLNLAGNLTSGGYVEATSYLYLRNNIRLLNKATNNWLSFATRNTAASEAVYDLAHVGTITNSGDINTSGDVHIDEGATSAFQTTNKLRFGDTSWNNNIGIESYWMVLGCNQNEGFKFRDSASNMLLQLNGGNSTSGNGAFSATFKGSIIPAADASLTLGTGSLRWNFAYINNALTVTDGNFNTTTSFKFNKGLVVEGSVDSGATDMGYYQSAGTNIVLKGDSVGRSGIFFESEKDGTNINDPSDYGFIQFHSYGYGNTSGEANNLVIGVANDSPDKVILQAPYNGGVMIGYNDATAGTGLTLSEVIHSNSSSYNNGNWDTAYTHSQATHAPSNAEANQTAAQLLTEIKTVDGSGSGLDADTVDGNHANYSYGVGKQYDFTVNGDADKYYPVVISGTNPARITRMTVFRGYSETAPTTWNTASHKGGLTLTYDIRVGSWGGYPNMLNVHDFGEIYSRICGGVEHTAHTMKHVVWLRGGTASYHIDSPTAGLTIEVNDSTSASNYVSSANNGTWYSYDNSNNAYDVTVSARTQTEADAGAVNLVGRMPMRYNNSFNEEVSVTNPVHTQAWSTITSTPTTISGYGITDAATPFSGSWNGSNMPGSRFGGYTANGGEIVFQQDNPNTGRMSVMTDGNFHAGENGGFYSLYSSSSYNSKAGFNTDANGVLQFTTNGTSALADFDGRVIAGNGSQAANSDAMLTLNATGFSGLDIKSARTSGNIGGLRYYDPASDSVPQAQFLVEVDGSYNFYNGTNGAEFRLKLNSDGHLLPGADSAYNLGSSATRWQNLFSDNVTSTVFNDGYITWTAAQLNRYGAAIELQFTPTNASTLVKIGANGSHPTIFNAYNGNVSLSGDLDFSSGTGQKIILGSQRAYLLPAQNTKMRILTLANLTSCRVYIDSSENAYNQPIVLDIFFNSQGSAKPVIHRNNNYQWHAHSNDIRFTSDTSGHIYAEKVAHTTGRTVNIRKVEEFKGTVTLLDGSTTQTGGGANEVIEGAFGSLQTSGDVTVGGDTILNTGNSGTFITNDTDGYVRISMTSASAQLGLFRNGDGGLYIGGSSSGFRIYNTSFSEKFKVDLSGNITGYGDLAVKGNILLTGDATTTSQGRMIDFTGFDKESTTDFSDRAYISHTVNTGGHAGSVLVISSQNDSNDGIAFATHASSLLRHNGDALFSEGHLPTWSEIESKPTTFTPSQHTQAASTITSGVLDAARLPVNLQNVASTLDNSGIYFRSSAEGISGEGWCTGHYAYNHNDGFLFLNRTTAAAAVPVFHIGGYNNAGYAGYATNDSIITLTRSDGTKTTGSAYAGKGLSSSIYYTNIIKTTTKTVFKDAQGLHEFTGNAATPTGSFSVGSASDTNQRSLHLHAYVANKSSTLKCTDGNLHIDSADGNALYLNFYAGASTNINFGNSNSGVCGTLSSSGLLRVGNDVVAYYSFSDKRLKKDIKTTENNLDKILSLRPVEYKWKEGPREGVKEIGLIAQEVEKVVPEVVRVQSRHDDENYDEGIDYKQVDYEHLVSTLIGAMQEQQDQINDLKKEIQTLKSK